MAWNQTPDATTLPAARASARKLRRSMTDAEKVLWRYLRDGFAGSGTHFRRQMPVGRYVADFGCIGHRLIVELDGPVHDDAEALARDRARDEYLRGQGFRVMRFRSEDVMLKRDGVLQSIRAALVAATPTPGPSPQGGGEMQAAAS